MIDSASVLSDDAGDKINAKMSYRSPADVSEMANRCDFQVSDANSDNESSEMINSTDQTQSNNNNNNNTSNQTNACNIEMNTIETTIVANISECSLNGLETNEVTLSPPSPPTSVLVLEVDANSVKYLPSATPSTATNLSPIVLSPYPNTTTIIDSCSDDDFDEIQKLFESKSLAIEKWLRERAPQDVLIKMHAATECARTPKSPKMRTSSVTSDLFQQWLAASPVQVSEILNNYINDKMIAQRVYFFVWRPI